VTVELATEVASRVGALDGVVAVALGGSLGRGRADRHADVDLAVYYDPARPFSPAEFRALVTELDHLLRQPGHPHGFHSHAYAAYVHHNLVLRDPDGALAARKARTSPYPPPP
jgi:predicted nucleotidyltransferase